MSFKYAKTTLPSLKTELAGTKAEIDAVKGILDNYTYMIHSYTDKLRHLRAHELLLTRYIEMKERETSEPPPYTPKGEA